MNWFQSAVTKVVGVGNMTDFWNEVWVGNQSLRNRFPRLFLLSDQQHAKVNEMGSMEGDGWQWDLKWRREFFEWERVVFQDLLSVIEGFQQSNLQDCWRWKADPTLGFTARSAYQYLINLYRPATVLSLQQQFVFNNLWNSAAPSKVIAFSWQLMFDRLPTRENLILRGMMRTADMVCPLCNDAVETESHLFLHCRVSAKLWYDIIWWIDNSLMLSWNVKDSFPLLVGCGVGKMGKKGLMIIWHALVWTIWKTRNNRIFNNGAVDNEEMLETVKRLSWQWFIGRLAKAPCLFYEWRWNPGNCFSRR
jgi:hypothetical protein